MGSACLGILAVLVCAPREDGDAVGPRIVKHFDFDERKHGNFDDGPMFWVRQTGREYPLYLSGALDESRGRQKPPSFKLQLDGGSLSYVYEGKELRVEPGLEYQVSGYAYAENLHYARFYMEAFYRDEQGEVLKASPRRSRLIGPKDNEVWTRFVVKLPPPPDGARLIGLTATLAQREIWSKDPPIGLHQIREDISATVWIDDIRVARSPHVKLSTGDAFNLFTEDEAPYLSVQVTDHAAEGLDAVLAVLDAEGGQLLRRQIEVTTSPDLSAQRVALELPYAGWYRAELRVSAENEVLAQRSTEFVILPSLHRSHAAASAARFGLVSESTSLAPEACRKYWQALGVGRMKLPIWSPDALDEQAPSSPLKENLAKLLRFLKEDGVQVVGVVSSLRSGESFHEDDPVALLEAIEEPHRSLAQAFLDVGEANSGLGLHYWQVGADGMTFAGDPSDSTWSKVIDQVRGQLGQLYGLPSLAAPAFLADLADLDLPVEAISLASPHGEKRGMLADQLQQGASGQWRERWISILDDGNASVDRLRSLSRLAERIVIAYFHGVDTTFVSQPWKAQRDGYSFRITPNESLLVARTAFRILAGARPVTKLFVERGVESYLFEREDGGVLALWDATPEDGNITFETYLGPELRFVDLWGRTIPPKMRPDGTVELTIGPTPVFLEGVDVNIALLRSSIEVLPQMVNAIFEKHKVEIELTNPYDSSLTGELRITGPAGWKISPTRTPLILSPGKAFLQNLELQPPLNAIAGKVRLDLEFDLISPDARRFVHGVDLDFRAPEFAVEVDASWDGEDIRVRAKMSNRGESIVYLRSYLSPPDRSRQYLPAIPVAPGRTVERTFRITNGAEVAGRPIRVGIREFGGPHYLNKQVIVKQRGQSG